MIVSLKLAHFFVLGILEKNSIAKSSLESLASDKQKQWLRSRLIDAILIHGPFLTVSSNHCYLVPWEESEVQAKYRTTPELSGDTQNIA